MITFEPLWSVTAVWRTEKRGVPFVLKNSHHACVKSGGIAGSERHYAKTVFLVVGGKECQFLLVASADTDLVVAGFIVQTDKVKVTGGVAKIVNGIVATRDGVFKG